MPSALPDFGSGDAVATVADALERVAGTSAGRNLKPGAELTSSPAVGIEPAAPWAELGHLGRCAEVTWRVRIIAGRWETAPALSTALACWLAAAPELRRLGYQVGRLEAPEVVQLAGQPYLATAFLTVFTVKE